MHPVVCFILTPFKPVKWAWLVLTWFSWQPPTSSRLWVKVGCCGQVASGVLATNPLSLLNNAFCGCATKCYSHSSPHTFPLPSGCQTASGKVLKWKGRSQWWMKRSINQKANTFMVCLVSSLLGLRPDFLVFMSVGGICVGGYGWAKGHNKRKLNLITLLNGKLLEYFFGIWICIFPSTLGLSVDITWVIERTSSCDALFNCASAFRRRINHTTRMLHINKAQLLA